MDIERGKAHDGSHYIVSESGYRTTRASNRDLAAIPKKDCALRIYCRASGSVGTLVGAVTRDDQIVYAHLIVQLGRDADLAVTFVPCRCGSSPTRVGGHLVSAAKVWSVVDGIRQGTRRVRHVDVSEVAA
jgi:hypothetical protein